MKLLILILFSVLSFPGLHAQKNKVKKIKFCGAEYNSVKGIANKLKDQFDFLQLQENDTIVDIGAASGWYEGAFSAYSPLTNIHFILVDIDSACLNQDKVDNMIAHYSGVRGTAITNSFHLVHNTPDSLYLPKESFKKVWLINIIHEIPDQAKMIRDVYGILKPGGELIVMEYMPLNKGDLHGGCKKPLLDLNDSYALFQSQGFVGKEHILASKFKKRMRVYMIRFIKPAN